MLKLKTTVAACFGLAAISGILATSSHLARSQNGDAPSAALAAPAAQLTVPDLAAAMVHSIVRVDMWGYDQAKDAKTGKTSYHCPMQTGTGFIVRCDRLGGDDTSDEVQFDLVTNHHVVNWEQKYDWVGPTHVTCSMHNVQVTSTTVVGQDTPADLAVIRVRARAPKGQTPKAINWADPNSVRVGDEVVAIGYARNFQGPPTVTRGIISAVHRQQSQAQIGEVADMLQTDAAINNGNSGGPLLNLRGEVLGVNTCMAGAQVTKDAQNNIQVAEALNLGFARCCRTARPIVEQILSAGKVTRIDPGCKLLTLQEMYYRFLGWPRGVLVGSASGPTALAAKQGIKLNDLIIAIGSAAMRPTAPDPAQESKVETIGDLENALALRSGDTAVWVRFIRPSEAMIASLGALAAAKEPAAYDNQGKVYWAFLR
jgi:S1-C subfamily serine protease